MRYQEQASHKWQSTLSRILQQISLRVALHQDWSWLGGSEGGPERGEPVVDLPRTAILQGFALEVVVKKLHHIESRAVAGSEEWQGPFDAVSTTQRWTSLARWADC